MKVVYTLFLVFSLTALVAQDADIVGDWQGVITQNSGGYRPQYDFEISIRKDATGKLYGQTYVSFDEVNATMRFTGEMLDEKTFSFQETEILGAAKLTDMDWCIKAGKLSLVRQGKKWLLTGPWWGQSGFGKCVPGLIVLKKKEPRA